MNRFRPILIIAALLAAGLIIWRLADAGPRKPYLPGYITGDTLDLAAPNSGTLASVAVADGQRVAPGQALFTIAPATLEAQGEQAAAGIRANQAQIASAEASLSQAEAQVSSAAATADRARRDFIRLQSVKRDDSAAVANKDLDAARATFDEANATLAAARRTADARRTAIAAARAQTEQAVGSEHGVQIQVGQLSPAAPAAGRVRQVYFQPGEWVPANQTVVSLLPDRKVKVRFFVPEKAVAHYRVGQTVRFSCDGCATGLSARIGYVSAEPEFTPPIIFSRDSRDRLVFMVEAYPANPERLNPGLPVEVEPLP